MKYFSLILLLPFYSNSQEFYSTELVDSIPVHFHFATNKIINATEITPNLETIRNLDNGAVVIKSYTDTVGTIEYNTELAEKRLQKVLELSGTYTVDNKISISTFNRNEQRETFHKTMNDTLFRRADILIYETKLTIELNKPYKLQIHFDGGKYELRPEAKKEIEKLALVMKQESELAIELHGHISGNVSNNALSQNRAESVKLYLIQNGIDAGRITCRSFDNKKKLVQESPWQNNPINQRVEVVFFKP